MNVVVIPTYHRSFKLGRVLDFYASHSPRFQVVLLDASTDPRHQAANQGAADRHASFVRRLSVPEEKDVVRRLLKFLEKFEEPLFAMGNDEDAFFPDFLDAAFERLRISPEYVAVTGRFVTV